MEIYISQLDESKKVVPILKEYNVGLEVVLFASPYILDDVDENMKMYKSEINEIINDTSISIHGPYADLIPGTRDRMIAKVTRERFEQGYRVAKELKAKKIVYHNSYTPKTYSYIEWMDNSIKFWKDFTKDKLEDIEIHIENTLEDEYELIKRLVEEIDHPNFSVCLDIGHVNAYSYLTLEQWMDGLGSKIKHMHIHNNYGDKDSHNGIQNGNMNIIELLTKIRNKMENTSISLEIVDINQLKESLEILEKHNFITRKLTR